MFLNVPANFEEGYLDKVAQFKEVKVLYGKLPFDFIGGGCETSLLKNISKDELFEYINGVKERGIQFNYVINSPSLNNEEFSETGREKLVELLDMLNQLDLESVTIANPFLVKFIKKNFKSIKLKASANFNIDSVEKARQVKEMGIDILVLDPLLVNRDFNALQKIRKFIDGEIEILLNNNCIMNCPYLNYHQSYLGNNSRGSNSIETIDYCYTNCSYRRISEPLNIIKSEWIRPEDIYHYEDIGYDRFKITDRCAPQDVLVKRIKAYVDKEYKGNLLDIIQHYYYKDSAAPDEYLANVYIDNEKLKGFIDYFASGKCDGRSCNPNCSHCESYANSAVSINSDFQKKWLQIKSNEMDRLL